MTFVIVAEHARFVGPQPVLISCMWSSKLLEQQGERHFPCSSLKPGTQ